MSWVTEEIRDAIKQTDRFLVETPKVARKFIKSVEKQTNISALDIRIYNKDTPTSELEILLKPLKSGKTISILTDSGIPGIADPGNLAVALAHQWGIKVKPLIGPSSLFLALASSGFNGQNFAFHGYLPIVDHKCAGKIRELENDSIKNNRTQIFIETPYRNQRLLTLLLKYLKPTSNLCVAFDITGPAEIIESHPVKEWKKKTLKLSKLPCVFLLHSH